ncbi:DUF5597 domain-containing protein [Spirosoma harenae]
MSLYFQIFTLKAEARCLRMGCKLLDEGGHVDGKWVPGRQLNGDQDHQGRPIHNPAGNCGIQKFKLYRYN